MVYFAKNNNHSWIMLTIKRLQLSFYRLTFAATISLFLFGAQSAHALKSDRDQPADIQADDTEFDFKKGTRTFINNVLAVQGTLRLKADKLIGIYENGALQKATMWGNLARFKQRPDGKPDDVQGWAQKMILDQQANTITLVGKAALQQGPQTARGETIIYNMATDTLQVKGGSRFGTGGQTGQARPNKKIADPFADDDTPPPPVATTSSEAKNEKSDDDSSDEKSDNSEKTPWVAPTTSGRSRLILKPRKKPKKVEDKDDDDDDKDSEDEKESENKDDNED